MDDILTVGATKSYESFRKTLGENFLVKDIGNLNRELSGIGYSEDFSLGTVMLSTSEAH